MVENDPTAPGQAPMREPTYYILLTMLEGQKHGYAILHEVEALSGGRVRLSTGTLYGALGRLLNQGLVTRVGPRPQDGDLPDGSASAETTRTRRYYTLTRQGRRLLQAEIDRLQVLLAAAHRQLRKEAV